MNCWSFFGILFRRGTAQKHHLNQFLYKKKTSTLNFLQETTIPGKPRVYEGNLKAFITHSRAANELNNKMDMIPTERKRRATQVCNTHMLQEYSLFLAGVKWKVRGTLRHTSTHPQGCRPAEPQVSQLTREHTHSNVNWFSQAKQWVRDQTMKRIWPQCLQPPQYFHASQFRLQL